MTSIAVLGAGAFGTALAISLARDGRDVSLWGRNIVDIAGMEANGTTGEKLPGLMLPPALKLEKDLGAITAKTLLIAVPMASLPEFTAQPAPPNARAVVACMKGIDPETGFTPTRILKNYASNTTTAVLTGPSFAIDIATGLPTALTLACVDE
ncbi:MAG: 2-dehydropantoate 2-reductase N-terminal domain-containing protein, partial [Pseudomonadota bacterium]